MIALHDGDLVLDESESAFVAEFMSNVAIVVGYHRDRLESLRGVKFLLLRALSEAAPSGGNAWTMLYMAVSNVIDRATAQTNPTAFAYLRAFLRENVDLVS